MTLTGKGTWLPIVLSIMYSALGLCQWWILVRKSQIVKTKPRYFLDYLTDLFSRIFSQNNLIWLKCRHLNQIYKQKGSVKIFSSFLFSSFFTPLVTRDYLSWYQRQINSEQQFKITSIQWPGCRSVIAKLWLTGITLPTRSSQVAHFSHLPQLCLLLVCLEKQHMM